MSNNLVIVYFGSAIFMQPVDTSYSPISMNFLREISTLAAVNPSQLKCRLLLFASLRSIDDSQKKITCLIVTLKISFALSFPSTVSFCFLNYQNTTLRWHFSLNIFPRNLKYISLRLLVAIREMVIFLVCSVNTQTI